MGSDDLTHIPTVETYRSILFLAATLADDDKSIECFFLLTLGGRRGLRVGELLHFRPEWYDAERGLIEIRSYDCDCALCKSYAKQKADREEELRDWESILEDDYWQPKSTAGSRKVPLKTEREIQAVEEYIARYGGVDISYRTIYRRIKRLAELHDDLNANHWSPHSLRATAATHLAWADFRQPALEGLFGWGSREFGVAYVRRTGIWVSREFDRILGLEDDPLELRADPPTRQELRADADELIEVDRWTPEQDDVPDTPSHRDAEEAFFDDPGENKTLTEFNAAVDPITLYLSSRYSPDGQATSAPQIDVTAAAAFGLAFVALAIVASWGDTWPVMLGGMIGFGLAVNDVQETDRRDEF